MTAERTDWLKRRQTGIGGSDVAAILGLSKWKTPLDVYNDKIADTPIEDSNPSIEWGNRLEPVIRQKFSDVTGLSVTVPAQTFRHPEHSFMIANVDGLLPDGSVLEIKTARSGADWGEEGTDEIPEYYLTQVQHYMTVTGAKRCDVAVLIGASDFRIYHVQSDPELEAMLIEEERAFWKRVEERDPPAPRTYAEAATLFRVSTAKRIDASEEVAQATEELARIKIEADALKKREDEAKAKIMTYMKDADTLMLGTTILATWKTSKPAARFDSASFKAKHPDLYHEFLKTGEPSRRFLLKYKLES